MTKVKFYSPLEEKINIISHAFGLALSFIALILLMTNDAIYGNSLYLFSFGVFGISLIILYAASTFYHSAKDPKLRTRLRVVDHASIYVLIAGTYTPFTLITLNSQLGWNIFYASWSMAFIGIILKIFFTGKFNTLSTLMYILMGWIIVFAIDELLRNLSSDGLFWLITGGLSYTLGAILYAIKKIKFNHAIFHIFVLIGSFSHFLSVRFYILPGP
ncbi:MAG: hemolysin III family protein [Pseudomonadota bacterium]